MLFELTKLLLREDSKDDPLQPVNLQMWCKITWTNKCCGIHTWQNIFVLFSTVPGSVNVPHLLGFHSMKCICLVAITQMYSRVVFSTRITIMVCSHKVSAQPTHILSLISWWKICLLLFQWITDYIYTIQKMIYVANVSKAAFTCGEDFFVFSKSCKVTW